MSSKRSTKVGSKRRISTRVTPVNGLVSVLRYELYDDASVKRPMSRGRTEDIRVSEKGTRGERSGVVDRQSDDG